MDYNMVHIRKRTSIKVIQKGNIIGRIINDALWKGVHMIINLTW